MSRKHCLIISAIGITGVGVYMMVRATIKTLDTIIDKRHLQRRQNPVYIYIDQEIIKQDINYHTKPNLVKKITKGWIDLEYNFSPQLWWERRKARLLWKLMQMSQEEEFWMGRVKPLKQMISFTQVSDSDYRHIAQICDAKSAVTLARIDGADNRFFVKPFHAPENKKKSGVLDRMLDLLVALNKSSEHLCLDYFIKKYEKERPYALTTDAKLFTAALESILHHCLTGNVVNDLVEADGLQLLYDVYQLDSNNYEIKVALVQILLEVSFHPQHLQELFETGWVKLLAECVKDQDQRLSSPAASALANLEKGCEVGCGFKNATYLLYPNTFEWKKRTIDVVLIHGLMGGPHSTWKKGPHNSELNPWQLIPGILNKRKKPFRKNKEILDSSENLKCDLSEFELVMEDIPLGVCGESDHTFTLTGSDMLDALAGDSQCWPKDWLPQTCSGIRMIGVNYYSTISDWVSTCPLRTRGLLPKAKYLLENLVACGVGERPVVWITHSMGGLILKHMLIEASKEPENFQYAKFCENTKAIYFFSTPHFGSPLISQGNEFYTFFFKPSKEVEELKLYSPDLIDLHDKFKNLVEKHCFKVTSFNEMKATKFSMLDMEFKCLTNMKMDAGTGVIYKLPLDHVDICKPSKRLSFIYQEISRAIQRICKENKCCHKNCV